MAAGVTTGNAGENIPTCRDASPNEVIFVTECVAHEGGCTRRSLARGFGSVGRADGELSVEVHQRNRGGGRSGASGRPLNRKCPNQRDQYRRNQAARRGAPLLRRRESQVSPCGENLHASTEVSEVRRSFTWRGLHQAILGLLRWRNAVAGCAPLRSRAGRGPSIAFGMRHTPSLKWPVASRCERVRERSSFGFRARTRSAVGD